MLSRTVTEPVPVCFIANLQGKALYVTHVILYYGPDIIQHIPIQNQWRPPQNYPECQPSGAAILNARNQY